MCAVRVWAIDFGSLSPPSALCRRRNNSTESSKTIERQQTEGQKRKLCERRRAGGIILSRAAAALHNTKKRGTLFSPPICLSLAVHRAITKGPHRKKKAKRERKKMNLWETLLTEEEEVDKCSLSKS